jgi:polar amino acid transport system permease protein
MSEQALTLAAESEVPAQSLLGAIISPPATSPRSALTPRTRAVYLLALAPPIGWVAVARYQGARAANKRGEHYDARVRMQAVRTWCWYTLSMVVVLALLAFATTLVTANGHAVLHTFFNGTVLRQSAPDVLRGFWLNVRLFVLAEALVLPWAFLVALVRMMPGKPGRPLRWLAVLYVDLFRGMPAVIVIYLIAFGVPIANLPLLGKLSSFDLCAVALVLVYGAYVAEVFRAGMEGVHRSQTGAARSLGLTHLQSMRYVVAPQAIRRIIPPLLNDFIGLQKDTSLVSFVGLLDAFNQSRIIASNSFNLSAVTGVGLFFVVITIPMARLVDYLSRRDASRTLRGGV